MEAGKGLLFVDGKIRLTLLILAGVAIGSIFVEMPIVVWICALVAYVADLLGL